MAQMHDVSDPRNADILINVNGELKPRAQAVVSVFDSGFMLGDGVWEGLRVHKGRRLCTTKFVLALFLTLGQDQNQAPYGCAARRDREEAL